MKVVGFNGSPRKGGNTSILIKTVFTELEKNGIETEFIQLGGSAITPVVGLDSVLLATLFSMAVGLFFGIYPATRAARLQPVEALRYE